MIYSDIYKNASIRLKEAGVPEYQLDARLLLEYVCGTDYNTLLVHGDRDVSPEEEKKYIEENRLNKTVKEIGKNLNKDEDNIRAYFCRNNLEYKRMIKRLTEEEKKYIEENRLNKTIRKMAKNFGLPSKSKELMNFIKNM